MQPTSRRRCRQQRKQAAAWCHCASIDDNHHWQFMQGLRRNQNLQMISAISSNSKYVVVFTPTWSGECLCVMPCSSVSTTITFRRHPTQRTCGCVYTHSDSCDSMQGQTAAATHIAIRHTRNLITGGPCQPPVQECTKYSSCFMHPFPPGT